MAWFTYNHLYYFWTVAKEGSIARATEKLNLTQPTISEQLKTLEETLGERLFEREGRRLVLTDLGRIVFGYAEEIFSLGRELVDVIEDRPTGRPLRFSVGVSDVVPKAIAYRLLAPVLAMTPEVHLICVEDQPARLLADLAIHELDLVISDAPSTGSTIRLFNHHLIESAVSLYASPAVARHLRKDFPRSLDGAPFLLPHQGSELRRRLEQWFDRHELRPKIVGEFQDSALLNAFARSGAGVFASIPLIEEESHDAQKVVPVGSIEELHESYYAIARERRIKHPAIAKVLASVPK